MKFRLARTAGVCPLLFIATSAAWGQSFQGGLRGSITDTAGASIPDAKVALVDQATGTSRATLTNAIGEYNFTAVNPSTYKVSVESAGFKRLEQSGVIVATQQFLTLDLKMELGEVSQSVQVTEEAPIIDSSNASTGQVVDRQKLVDLPNLGRNPFMMSKIAQNVVPAGDPRFNRMQDQSGSSQISIAGGPVRGNNYLLDGVPITDFQNRAVIIPTIESVQEVKIQANTYDAEMGRTGGGVFNTYLKSGSNALHGSAFGYMRQPEWLANPFFFNRSAANQGLKPDTPFRNYGGSFGGPVRIPKLYNGTNKTFFFLGGEAYRQRSADAADFPVPTALERAGDFSQSRTATGAPLEIFDPLSTRSNGAGGYVRDAFAGGVIPGSRINPIGAAIASYFPAPQRAATFHGQSNYTASTILGDRADQLTGKFDHEFAPWFRSSFSYLHYGSIEPNQHWFGSIATPGGNMLYRKVDATQWNNILTPNATTVLSIRYGFNRFPNQVTAVSEAFSPAQLGFSPSYVASLQQLKFPRIEMQNFARAGNSALGSGDTSQTVYHSKNFLVSVSKFMGRHSLKAGFDYRVINVDGFNLGSAAGRFEFDDTFTRRNPLARDGSGSDLASLLLGYPWKGEAQVSTKLAQYVRYYSGYFHDDFRVSSRLTLNLGLRYEYETGLGERNDNFISGFDATAVNPIGAAAGVDTKGVLMYAGVNGYPTKCCNLGNKRFAPRIGAAYRLNDKTTLRGGYGLFYAPARYDLFNPLGYTQVSEYVASNDGNLTPAGSLTNPFPSGLLAPAGNSAGALAGIGRPIDFYYQDAKAGRVQQFSFDIQRELPLGIALAFGYVGSRSDNLAPGSTAGTTVNLNQLDPQYLSMGSSLLQAVSNPFFGKGGVFAIGSSTVARNQLMRPYPQFGNVNAIYYDSNHARYDSFAIKAQKRFSAGLTFLTTWTFSKNFDASFGSGNTFTTIPATAPQNAYDLDAEYGLAIVDVPHRWVSSVTYELPFGRGKAMLSSNKMLDLAVGGWQINAVSSFQSGFPLAIVQQNLNSALGMGVQRPNATGVSPVVEGSVQARMDGYINRDAFSQAPQFTFGNLSRTIDYRGPGQANWDLSMFKTFSITEQFRAQFRAEAMNAFNTPIFNGPETNLANANFGKITRQANFPRYLQLGVRFYF